MNTKYKIKVQNTLSKKKEIIQPLVPQKISLYVCGMTVYDYCHLGHARVMAFFDTMVRYLRDNGYSVEYIRNITDIDDKIFMRAGERGISFNELTAEFISAMHSDFTKLGLLEPDKEPRVTEYIDQIINIIQLLIKRGYAYSTKSGDVYYKVKQFDKYGQLSGKNIDELQSGIRVESSDEKLDPLDFALWKSVKPKEPSWNSPWGLGRPGWHIECSAMSTSILGNDFDIHGGGPDLIFPHHENEIAQSCGAFDCNYANYWMHVGPLRVAGEKMSKSLGNFLTIKDVLKLHKAEHIRFFLARTHYRSPIQFTIELIEESASALDRLYQSISNLQITDKPDLSFCEDEQNTFHQAMHDDFHTPKAIAALFALSKKINTIKDENPNKAGNMASILLLLARSIGLMQANVDEYLTTSQSVEVDKEYVESLIAKRNQAKISKNFQLADEIRQELLDKGIVIEDSSLTTTWRCK